ncbi:MAG: hypothetical protein SOW08_06410 [Lachnospiraceae bacterium]|nr:hypothetical protein [Lachnospiraceae bacterium]
MRCNVCGAEMVDTGDEYICGCCGSTCSAGDKSQSVSGMKEIYAEAFRMMQEASDYESYMEASLMFQKIPYYEDSMRLAQQCINAAGDIKLEEDYQKALTLFSQNSERSVQEAMELFLKVADYKESNDYLVRAQEKLEMIRSRKGSVLFQGMVKKHTFQSWLLIVSNLLIFLSILSPWYQARGTSDFLFWEIDTVVDSVALIRAVYQVFRGYACLWWGLFLICMSGSSVTLGRGDFRKSPFFIMGLLILLWVFCSGEPPAGYGKAGFGQFFMAAGLVGFLMNWIAVYIASKRKGAQRRSDGMSRRSGDSR